MNAKQKNTPEDNGNTIAPRQLLLQEMAHKLVEARTEKQEAISRPVRKLKISANHLKALESGNWENLPDDVYVIGFLRQYSKYLGIDLTDEIDRLKNTDYKLTRPLTFPDPPVAPSRMWAWLTGGAFVVLFILFNVINRDDEQEETVVLSTPTPQLQSTAPAQNRTRDNNIARVQTDVVKTVSEPAVATTARAITPVSKVTSAIKAAPATPAIKQVAKVDGATVTFTAKTNKPVSAASPTAKQTDKQTISSPPRKQVSKTPPVLNKATTAAQQVNRFAHPTNTVRHVFRFEAVTAPIWMQIFLPNKAGDGKGRLLKEMLLKKGHYANIRYATETLWITCGNALALRIKVDRKIMVKTGGLGNGKKVLRDYRFDINTQ